MPFKKGQSGNPKGRKKGEPLKVTVAFKTAVLRAYDGIGGDDTFQAWARENPTEFYKIAARLIPSDGKVDVTATVLMPKSVVYELHKS